MIVGGRGVGASINKSFQNKLHVSNRRRKTTSKHKPPLPDEVVKHTINPDLSISGIFNNQAGVFC